jgi:hypothetical protein
VRHRPLGRGEGARRQDGRAALPDAAPGGGARRRRLLVELLPVRGHEPAGDGGAAGVHAGGGDLFHRRGLHEPGGWRRAAGASPGP